MRSNLTAIIRKELSRFFMDKKLFLTTVIMPGLMIYIIYTLMGGVFSNLFTTGENYVYQVAVVNPPSILGSLLPDNMFSLREIDEEDLDAAKREITDAATDLCMVFPADMDEELMRYDVSSGLPAPEIQMFYNSGETASLECFQNVSAVLDAYETSLANKFDVNLSEDTYDLADGTDLLSRMMTAIIPMLFLTLLFSGCCAIAPDFIAGEKERGTIATLLVTPMKRSSLALGKIVSMSIMTLLSGISSFLGVALSLPKLAGFDDDAGSLFDFSGLAVGDYVLLLILILSVTLVLISILSLVSAQSKTVKESSTIIGPLNIVIMIVGIAGGYLGALDTGVATSLIPVYNFAKCMSAILCGTATLPGILVTFFANLVYTGLCVWLLTKMFDSEKIMFQN